MMSRFMHFVRFILLNLRDDANAIDMKSTCFALIVRLTTIYERTHTIASGIWSDWAETSPCASRRRNTPRCPSCGRTAHRRRASCHRHASARAPKPNKSLRSPPSPESEVRTRGGKRRGAHEGLSEVGGRRVDELHHLGLHGERGFVRQQSLR